MLTILAANWRLILLATLVGALTIQTHRIGVAKDDNAALQRQFDEFKAQVRVTGEIAQKAANEAAERSRKAKETADEDHKRTVALLNQRIASMRHDADSAGRYLMPAAAPGSKHPELVCFDRAEFGRANGAVLAKLRGIADQGDTAITGLNAAREWAKGR